MNDQVLWIAVLSWVAEHAPPLVAGFLGGIIGGIVRDYVMKRKRKEDSTCSP